MDRDSLVSVLEQQVGLSKEQALDALIVVFDHAKQECPVLRGNINSFLDEEMAFVKENNNEPMDF
ncbi:MAG: hypothetical protein ABIN57_01280 [Chitinophagaceae bacterium]